MSIRNDGQAYRRGVVFGFTVAEVVLLLVFCLLLLFAPVLLAPKENAGTTAPQPVSPPNVVANKPQSTPSTSPMGPPGRSWVDKPKEEAAWLPPGWKVLVLGGHGTEEPATVQNGNPTMAPPSGNEPKPGLTLDVVCQKLSIPAANCTALKAEDALKNAGKHNWPPIIPLKEADGYYFIVGSAQPSSEFETKLRNAVVVEIVRYAKEFKTDVIEVVGHTDEQPIRGMASNLDTTTFDVLLRSESAGKMSAADNAGLGFARAVAIVQILRSEQSLRDMTILPLSAAQVVDVSGKLADGAIGGDVKQRRRIEIRLRQSAPPEK